MARNTITIYASVDVSSCDADADGAVGGPIYRISYSGSSTAVENVQVGDWVTVNKRVAGAGGSSTISSVYTYQVTAIINGNTLDIKYISDSAEEGDDSPCDLPSGTGSSGSPNKAPHKFTRDLGSAFKMFIDI
jgi:hypothetical protein